MNLDAFEHREVNRILDALQVRADSIIFSRESLELSESRSDGSADVLERVFGVNHLSNDAVDRVLKEVHENYMLLARGYLPVDLAAPEKEDEAEPACETVPQGEF